MIMKNFRKGQAALEFLTTYGWAFLVILVMIGALAYFGVLDPSNFVADRCVMGSPLTCNGQNYVLYQENATVQVRNALNQQLTITNMTYQSASMTDYEACDNATTSYVAEGSEGDLINRDSLATIRCDFDATAANLVAGTKERVLIEMRYHTGDPTFTRTIAGEVYSEVQEN
jgi:hypothetical protein